jgi:hypothetical protein
MPFDPNRLSFKFLIFSVILAFVMIYFRGNKGGSSYYSNRKLNEKPANYAGSNYQSSYSTSSSNKNDVSYNPTQGMNNERMNPNIPNSHNHRQRHYPGKKLNNKKNINIHEQRDNSPHS